MILPSLCWQGLHLKGASPYVVFCNLSLCWLFHFCCNFFVSSSVIAHVILGDNDFIYKLNQYKIVKKKKKQKGKTLGLLKSLWASLLTGALYLLSA